jgi:hypothetical protein
MTDGFLGISWFVWAVLAAALAAMFAVIQILKQTSQTTGFTHIVLRWFHSVTWVFLALSFLVRGAAPRLSAVADVVGLAGLGSYIAFRSTMSRTRPASSGPKPRLSPRTKASARLGQRERRPSTPPPGRRSAP